VGEAVFVAEARSVEALPPAGPPEVAIAGRSNVGKSTLLNRLAGRAALARTSKTPGRTRGIVFFDLTLGAGPDQRILRLADLPGYGYARVSKDERQSWQPLVEGYARRRPALALFLVLIDARRGVEDEERQLIEWLPTVGLPAQVVFTKPDKLPAARRGLLDGTLRSAFPGLGLPRPLLVSGATGEGVADLWRVLLRACGNVAAGQTPA
jgi:GTP-binding protein